MHTQTNIFDAEISAKTSILAGFRASDKSFSKMMPKHSQWVSGVVRTLFGAQRVGYDGIKSQIKHLHTYAQTTEVGISGQMVILAIFKSPKWSKCPLFENDAETCPNGPETVLGTFLDVENGYGTFIAPQ